MDPGDGPTLVLDAATTPLQTGILRGGQWASLRETPGEALESIFGSVAETLRACDLRLEELRAVALGIGPGSILGLRLALMALQTWRELPAGQSWKLFQFHGFTLRARLHQLATRSGDAHYLSDFRRGSWHLQSCQGGTWSPLEVLSEDRLATLGDTLYYLPTGRLNPAVPARATPLNVGLEALPALLATPPPWVEPVAMPALYLPDPPTYRAWSPERHRGPG